MQRIPDDSSIFTAETKAIDLALDFISTYDANNKFIIFSDSLSALKAMNHISSKFARPFVCSIGDVWSTKFCSNDDPKLTLTYLTPRSTLLPNAFKWDFFKVEFLNTVEAIVIILA